MNTQTTSTFDLLARDVKRELAENPAEAIGSLLFGCTQLKAQGIELELIEPKAQMCFSKVAQLKIDGQIMLEPKNVLLIELCDLYPNLAVDLLCLALSMVQLDFNQYTSVFSKVIAIDHTPISIKELNRAKA